ncbi:MAG: hypothetical protein WBW94_04380 [Anaerolineales bacterium]
MDYKRIGFIIGILLLLLMSACGPAGVTPAPQGPGAGIIQNNPGGPIQLAPTSTTPTAAPTASNGCNQLGCPYPAVCDKTSGVCTINQAQGPGGAAPQAPGDGIIANNPGSNSLLPVCPPPSSSISKITSFCANPAAGQGGASIVWSGIPITPQAFSSYYVYEDDSQVFADKATCDINDDICSGPQDTKITIIMCSICSSLNTNTWQSNLQNDPSVCPTGFSLTGSGDCENPAYDYNNGGAPVMPCVTGTHYDNDKQNCIDDVTGKIASPCPPGYPYLYVGISTTAQCYKYPQAISYNCQPYTIPLGACTGPIKKVCQQPSGGCGYNLNGTKKHWNQSTCSCQ